MTIAYIKPQILAWAMHRRVLSADQLATKTMTAESILAWAKGERLPTELQAEVLAAKLRIPYLVLFLDSPPDLDSPSIPDLRTVGGRTLTDPSIDFIDTLSDALLRQDWYRDYKEANSASSLGFVGKYSLNDSPQTVADDMRLVMGFDKDFREQFADWNDMLKGLTLNAEKAGILVMRSGLVGHATNRKLDVNEFRGFALSDPLAPLVFVNGRDARAAQNFTLAHEFAHIWIGRSGISNLKIDSPVTTSQNAVERFCNQVAAEFLVPSSEFLRIWNSKDSFWANVQRVSTSFKVSSLVVLLRALDNQVIQYPAFKSAFEREEERATEQANREDSGGHFWNGFPWRVSHLFGQTVVQAVLRERTTYSEAASLLGLNVSSFESYLHQESGG